MLVLFKSKDPGQAAQPASLFLMTKLFTTCLRFPKCLPSVSMMQRYQQEYRKPFLSTSTYQRAKTTGLQVRPAQSVFRQLVSGQSKLDVFVLVLFFLQQGDTTLINRYYGT